MTDKTLCSLFTAQVVRNPDAIAVVLDDKTLTYGALDRRADALACRLAALGAGAEQTVGLCVARSFEMVVGLLAILKAGASYLPLDPAYPAERLAFMLADTQASLVLTQTALAGRLPDGPHILCLDTDSAGTGTAGAGGDTEVQPTQAAATAARENSVACVLYTSGSTGTPKGVLIPHGGIVRLVRDNDYVEFGPQHAVMQIASPSFDAFTFEVWGALLNGARLVLMPPHTPSLKEIGDVVARHGVTTLLLTAGLFHLMADENMEGLRPLSQLLAGGDALSVPHVRRVRRSLPHVRMINAYGPTECSTIACAHTVDDSDLTRSSIPIGRAIARTQALVLGDDLQPVPEGTEGELFLGGEGLALGYLNQPELTAEKFLPSPLVPGGRVYRTGDRARVLPGGELEFLGRTDGQVKVRGYRIEPGEVEHALAQHPLVRQCAVAAYGSGAAKSLAGYLVTSEPVDAAALRLFLGESLPPYMIPSRFVFVDTLPLTLSGKVDRKALPKPDAADTLPPARPAVSTDSLERRLAELWRDVLQVKTIGPRDNFFDLGATSLHMMQMQQKMTALLGEEPDITLLFQYPTVGSLAKHLGKTIATLAVPAPQGSGRQNADEPIAVVGMAGRYPGASSVEQFWWNITHGVESITKFSEAEMRAAGVPEELIANPDYVRARAVLDNVDMFDASFFGMTPREADVTDPQHRVFLECAWEAMEQAGYSPETSAASVGVYAGLSWNTYLLHNLLSDRRTTEEITGSYQVGHYHIVTGNANDFLPSRVSYKLNLKGPSVSIQSGCSTSLVAICQAVQALRAGQCDMALAGGVSISFPQTRGYLYQEGGMVSRDGHCRAFDADSAGTVFGSGAGVVVLKPLSAAVADGDTIYAVIKGAALNNDGADKFSYTAPSVDGQAAVIALAHAQADVSPDTITYIETHGTGTPLGDPIEIAGLTQAFRRGTDRTGYCAIGSVKASIGHLEAAAGVTGLIKTSLALRHKVLPPTQHYQSPNPRIDFARSPFFVNAALTEWKREDAPRRAGVSSFGVGGTNAHVVLEEAPETAPGGPSRPWQLLALSAKTPSALQTAAANMAAHFTRHPDADMADAAYTLSTGRRMFDHKSFVVCRDGQDAAAVLSGSDPKRLFSGKSARRDAPVVFMFPGQGAQQVGMGRELYQSEQVYRECVDACAEILEPLLGQDIRATLYPAPGHEDDAQQRLAQTGITQPALFAAEYALAKLWMSWGIVPSAMIGHSVGEYVAACLSGVFTLPDALRVLAARARLMQNLPPGAMLAVRLPEAEVRALLPETLSVAAINSPALCVVSGPQEDVDAFGAALEARSAACRRLHTSHAFHSAMMEPALEPFAEIVASVPRHAPQIPYVSNLTATWATEAQAADPHSWASHLREAVRFADGVGFLLAQGNSPILLEVGPGQTLASLARQHPARAADQSVLASLDTDKGRQPESAALLTALGQLWLAGAPVNWNSFYAAEHRRRVPLPTYPFERKRHWVEPVLSSLAALPALVLLSKSAPENSVPPLTLAALQPHSAAVGSHSGGAFARMIGNTMTQTLAAPPAQKSRAARIIPLLTTTLHEISGVAKEALDPEASFLELGFDSLFLTQASQAFAAQFGVKITFRNLLETTPTLSDLAAFIDEKLSPDALPAEEAPPTPVAAAPPLSLVTTAAPSAPELPALSLPAATAYPARTDDGTNPSVVGMPMQAHPAALGAMEQILGRQLEVMTQQLALLQGTPAPAASIAAATPAPAASIAAAATPYVPSSNGHSNGRGNGHKNGSSPIAGIPPVEAKPFGPFKPIEKGVKGALTERQQAHLDGLIARTIAQTPKSKAYTQENRAHLCDPRVVSGFKSAWKEMVYPIVVNKSAGSKLWDIDGNEWLDITMGFGISLFGHTPPFVADAVRKQLDKGIEIGPQAALAGEVARRICAMTGMERATFCNTGSEAVMAALRVARTVTGRLKIVYFNGDYHGMFDEVLARANHVGGEMKSAPIAPGIPPGMVQDTLILEYGSPESLQIIQDHAHELAAVVVEPVQGRSPDMQPREFLHALRRITQASGTALIFDEVITGFRVHPGGAQAYFDVRADMATYGKVIGGGLPFGVLTGKAQYMDAFDGGAWQYGDDSFPEVGVTFFAGTFVRHPLVLASAQAVLDHLEEHGPALQETLNRRAALFVARINAFVEARGVPMRLANFGSWFYPKFAPELKWASLLFYELRARGIHIWEGRAGFLSTAHTDDDLERLAQAFEASVCAMQDGGFFPAPPEGDAPPPTPSGQASPPKSAPGPDAAPGMEPVTLGLTDPQREVWLATQMGEGASCALIESVSVHLRGPLDVEALQNAVQLLPQRHQSLRTTFASDGETQTVHPSVALDVPFTDFSHLAAPVREAEMDDLLTRDGQMPFNQEQGPLLRAQIVRLEAAHHVLVLSAHHLVCDGWSFGLLLSEIGPLYEAQAAHRPAALPMPALLTDYVASTRQEAHARQVQENEAWWQAQVTPAPSPLVWPSDHARPLQSSYRGAILTHAIGPELTAQLRKIGFKQGCTMVATLFAGYAALLRRLTGQDDIVIGLPAAGQSGLENGQMVGHCVNLLPVRVQAQADAPFSELLARVKRGLFDAYDHQNFTFSRLLASLPVNRERGQMPLVATTFNVDRMPDFSFGPLAVDVRTNPRSFYQFDFSLNVIEAGASLSVECHYSTDLFEAATVSRWLGHFETLLAGIAADPSQAVACLPLLTEAEQSQLLADESASELHTSSSQSIQSRFEAQAAKTPQAVAVQFEGQALTYGQMNARANQLAHALRARGVGPDERVGLCLHRSLDMAVAVLAVLKAGGAYVPLDPAYPPERLRLMLDSARPRALVTHSALAASLPAGGAMLCVDAQWPAGESEANPEDRTQPSDLCFVIYTSGSTGVPKGVALPHSAADNLVQWQLQHSRLGQGEKTLQFASLSFDVSFQEMFSTWAAGGALVLIPEEVRRDPQGLLRLIDREKIARLFLPFVALQQLVEGVRDGEPVPQSLREIMTAGEQLQVTPGVVAFFRKSNNCVLHNQYGPTETAVIVTSHTLTGGPETWPALPPIGKPIPNVQALILDEALQPVPIGIEGELHLGGACLARGYLGQPQMTEEKFIPHPSRPGARLYKSGDRARFLADGSIEYLGRADGQVKVRGFRIEMGEVEQAVSQHPQVRQCVVVPRREGADQALIAYVVTIDPVEAAPLRAFLAQSLPSYMIPTRFVSLERFPLTPSGKVDRKALPAPELYVPPTADLPAAPMDETEQRLVALWQSVLQVKKIGPHDSFFDLGGHSLLAVRLFVQIEREFGRRLPLPSLFQAPTVAQMAALLRREETPNAASSILVPIQAGGTQPPLFCMHHIDGIVVCYGEMTRYLGPDQPVYGIQAPALTGETAPPTRIEDMAAQYAEEIVRAYPSGPYRVCGISFGGVVAFEVACRLRAQGRTVEFVGLLDSYAPAYFRSEHAAEGERPLFQRLAQQWDMLRRLKGSEGALVKAKAQSAVKRLRDVLPAAARVKDLEVADYLPAVLEAVRHSNMEAQREYYPPVYPGKVVLFRAVERLDMAYNDPLLSWGGLAEGGFEVREVLGNHYTIVKEPFVRTLAESMRTALAESHAC